jgi:hypothetical protein
MELLAADGLKTTKAPLFAMVGRWRCLQCEVSNWRAKCLPKCVRNQHNASTSPSSLATVRFGFIMISRGKAFSRACSGIVGIDLRIKRYYDWADPSSRECH